MVGLTRRALLARGAAGLVLAGCGGGSSGQAAPSPSQLDVRLLTRALESEIRSVRIYAELAPRRGARARLVRRLEDAEERHVDALDVAIRRLGGGAPEVGTFAYVGESLREALADEERSVDDYLDLLPRLQTPAARTLVGFILAEEAAHLSALRVAFGSAPVEGAFL